MKYFMLLGGFAGFLLAFSAGLFAANEIDRVLVDATVGCLVGAALMRGFRHLYIRSLRNVVLERARQSAATAAAETPSPTQPA